ncbi:hypothetical protein [Candidatus Thiodiazotropha sp. CDECU1]|uniref:hypothetical protein n=1 Tax=Candidatus Thiodiazotropha sp. CDECU1 TaxID=3065865 RepID=UPI00292F8DA1|nr:hypothetical protein [Candidatus Thiodiazotropha sp. CDECU1]
MEVGLKVKLKTFNGDSDAPEKCNPSENYWALIGKTGTIVKPENDRSRVLMQFDDQVSDFGLHCHNDIPNSLLILTSDVEVI